MAFVALETGSKIDDFDVILGSSQILSREWVEGDGVGPGDLINSPGDLRHET